MVSFRILPDRGVLRIGGADARAFLQGLVSNDIAKVSPRQAIHASLLTAQGRYLHDFFIAEIGDDLVLDGELERLEDLRRRLSLYKLRSKVTIAVATDALAVAAAWGDGSATTFGLDGEAGGARAWADGVAFVDPRLAAMGVRAIASPAALASASSGFAAAGADDYDRHRLPLGIPDGSRDLPIEKAILLENGFDELNGVDWKKGCYIGQELTARTKYRGLVKKRLMPVTIEGPLPQPGTLITVDGQEAGEMRSAAGRSGLALLRLEAVEKAAAAGVPLLAGETKLHPSKPSWAMF